MSGYLQRLVQRTLGSEAVVQPLIAPRFSSPPLMLGEFEEAQGLEGTPPREPDTLPRSRASNEGESSPQLPPASRSVVDLSPVEAVPAPSGEDRMPSAASDDLRGRESGEPAPHITLPAADPVEALTHLTTAAEEVPEGVSRVQPRHATQPKRDEGDAPTGVSASAEMTATSSERQRSEQPIPQPVRRETADFPLEDTRSQTAARDAREPHAGETDRPRRGPDPSLPEAAEAGGDELPTRSPTLPSIAEVSFQDKPQPQPVIRVTIGRIEVRATPPPPVPAPQPRAPRPAPALSLQEYLEQRNGGER